MITTIERQVNYMMFLLLLLNLFCEHEKVSGIHNYLVVYYFLWFGNSVKIIVNLFNKKLKKKINCKTFKKQPKQLKKYLNNFKLKKKNLKRFC